MIKTQDLKKILKNRIFWELKKAYQSYLSKSPQNCKFCGDFMLKGSVLDVCLIKGQKGINPLFLTEDGIYLCDQEEAKKCNKFSCKHDKESLKNTFEVEVLRNPDKMRESYKDIYVLTHLIKISEENDNAVSLTVQTITIWDHIRAFFKQFIRKKNDGNIEGNRS
jgi:hypothetical protein